jgi:hypothetical protein
MNVSEISAGITLALFGGVQKNSMDQNKVPVRGDIHVIVVGNFLFFYYHSSKYHSLSVLML